MRDQRRSFFVSFFDDPIGRRATAASSGKKLSKVQLLSEEGYRLAEHRLLSRLRDTDGSSKPSKQREEIGKEALSMLNEEDQELLLDNEARVDEQLLKDREALVDYLEADRQVEQMSDDNPLKPLLQQIKRERVEYDKALNAVLTSPEYRAFEAAFKLKRLLIAQEFLESKRPINAENVKMVHDKFWEARVQLMERFAKRAADHWTELAMDGMLEDRHRELIEPDLIKDLQAKAKQHHSEDFSIFLTDNLRMAKEQGLFEEEFTKEELQELQREAGRIIQAQQKEEEEHRQKQNSTLNE